MQKEKFGSRFGSIVVIAGSAVGLGNIWRFPYMVGCNGGAAFILIYLLFVILVCLPIMISELAIGRKSGRNAFCSFAELSPRSKFWKNTGLLYIFIPTAVLSYYCVIGGITVEFFARSLGIYAQSTPAMSVAWMAVFLLMTAIVVANGVQKGIEKFSKVMMPLLFVIVAVIAVRSMTLTGAGKGIDFLFRPDFSKVDAKVCLEALGQAFFSLSIGSGVLMTYGSYVAKKDNLVNSASTIAFFDLLFAIIAGCAVIPAVFALQTSPEAVLAGNKDSQLVFNVLPDVFPMMPFGAVVGAFFFFALIIAALTSSISQFEVSVGYLAEEKGWSRSKASLLVFCIAFCVGTLCALKGEVLGGLDFLCANILMPLGGTLAVIYIGWFMKRSDFRDELSSDGERKVGEKFLGALLFLIKYVAPIAIFIIFLTQLLSNLL